MKAAVLHEANQPLVIEDVVTKKPGSHEVLINTAFAGLCHSDLHFIDGIYPHPLPAVLGHESAGVIDQVGSEVTYVQPGDHVITCLSVFCGTCEQCTDGKPNLCSNTDVKMLPGKAERLEWEKQQRLHSFLNLSSFAEQMLVHENAVVKIRKDMPLDKAALIGCGVVTGFGAAVNTAKVSFGQSVAVIGCGGVIPFGEKIELHGWDFLRERKVQGSSMGSNRFRTDMPRLIELYFQGRLHLEDFIADRIKLDEINDGFQAMRDGKGMRSVIDFGMVI
jgi:Zn-dependent alcohol dehydrogenase